MATNLDGVILSGGSGKQLARTLPNQVLGMKAVVNADGVVITCDPPTELSSLYLKDYWVTYKPTSQGEIQHPYDGEHMTFTATTPS